MPGFVVEYRKYPNAASPLGFAEPFNVAELDVSKVAADVTAVGALGVVNDMSDPKAVPSALEAMAEKKYVVPIERPVIDCENGWPELPEPRADPPLVGARIPNISLHVPGLIVLYRNHPVVDALVRSCGAVKQGGRGGYTGCRRGCRSRRQRRCKLRQGAKTGADRI